MPELAQAREAPSSPQARVGFRVERPAEDVDELTAGSRAERLGHLLKLQSLVLQALDQRNVRDR